MYARRNELQLGDSAKWYGWPPGLTLQVSPFDLCPLSITFRLFENIDRMAGADYVPTADDVLRARVRSRRLSETMLSFENFRQGVYELAGGRSEMRSIYFADSWMDTVVLCVAISEYDLVLHYDGEVVSYFALQLTSLPSLTSFPSSPRTGFRSHCPSLTGLVTQGG